MDKVCPPKPRLQQSPTKTSRIQGVFPTPKGFKRPKRAPLRCESSRAIPLKNLLRPAPPPPPHAGLVFCNNFKASPKTCHVGKMDFSPNFEPGKVPKKIIPNGLIFCLYIDIGGSCLQLRLQISTQSILNCSPFSQKVPLRLPDSGSPGQYASPGPTTK